MKNVTIALDDETHRQARIRAAELGTSLSALVKDYLNGLVPGNPVKGVEDMAMTFNYEPLTVPMPPLRKLGQMKGEIWYADDFDSWPDEIQKTFDAMYEGAIVPHP